MIVQYRDKNPADAVFLAKELVKVCHQHKVPLIINDDVELAASVGADGVHIGKEDGAIAEARKHLGNDAIIGVSCYNLVERAIEAQAQGATYVAFGRFFPSSSKPLAAPVSSAPSAPARTATKSKTSFMGKVVKLVVWLLGAGAGFIFTVFLGLLIGSGSVWFSLIVTMPLGGWIALKMLAALMRR